MGKCAANDSNCVEMLAFEKLTILSMQKQKCTITVDMNWILFEGVSVIVQYQ